MVCDLACDFQELYDTIAEDKESRLCLRTTCCGNVKVGLLTHVTAKVGVGEGRRGGGGGICGSNVGVESFLLAAIIKRLIFTPYRVSDEHLELSTCVCRHMVCKSFSKPITLLLLGIHSTKYGEFLFCAFHASNIC